MHSNLYLDFITKTSPGIHIIGDGRHADVLEEILLERNKSILSREVYDPLSKDYLKNQYFIVAIGDNKARVRISRELESRGLIPYTLIHKSAQVSNSAYIGQGAQILENTIISTKAFVGDYSLINIGSVIGHHSKLEPGVSTGSLCNLGGGSYLYKQVMLGNNSTTIPNIHIARNVKVGAGAAVVKNIPEENSTYAGVPAKRIN